MAVCFGNLWLCLEAFRKNHLLSLMGLFILVNFLIICWVFLALLEITFPCWNGNMDACMCADPDAEVIALSPKTLMATNRFICEVCNKGFQREQNLQLHRRGHNLPWKLKQKTNKEPKRKVYLCPEPTCVHHDPSRALGDLTGIKKHYSRKHGEKKWKCDKCSKKYAVQSDWKAHSKTCGTREYRCDCGTLFSRYATIISQIDKFAFPKPKILSHGISIDAAF